MSDFSAVNEGRVMSEPPRDDDNGKKNNKRPRGPKEFSASGKRGDDFITRNLRKVYEEVAAEPLPDDLMALLNELDVAEAEQKSKDKSND
jgi:hypothetical protein